MAGTYSSGYLDHQKYCPYVKLKFSPQLNQVRLVISCLAKLLLCWKITLHLVQVLSETAITSIHKDV